MFQSCYILLIQIFTLSPLLNVKADPIRSREAVSSPANHSIHSTGEKVFKKGIMNNTGEHER